jgi:hypothetical protein
LLSAAAGGSGGGYRMAIGGWRFNYFIVKELNFTVENIEILTGNYRKKDRKLR